MSGTRIKQDVNRLWFHLSHTLDEIFGMNNLFSIQRINPASHRVLLLLLDLDWLLIFVWTLPADMSWLLAYKASSLVLVTFSSIERPTSFTLRNGTLAVVHFLVLSSFRTSLLPLTLPRQLSTSCHRSQRLFSELASLDQCLVLPDSLCNHQVSNFRTKPLFESFRFPNFIRLVL